MNRALPSMLSLAVACGGLAAGTPARADLDVYDDALRNGWANWSWASVDFSATNPVHGGTRCIRVDADGWEALSLHTPALNAADYSHLTFWVHGGAAGGQPVYVQATLNGVSQAGVRLAPLPTNEWRQVSVRLEDLGVANAPNFDGFWLQLNQSTPAPSFYVDDIVLVSAPAGPAAPVVVAVDALADRHPINPLIYGVAFASSNALLELNVPLNRSGGNATSRYNWQTNASNHASDWYFESLEESGSVPGGSADRFVRDSLDGGAAAMLTIPINGWVARLGPGGQRLCSYSIAKYGAQTGSDWQWFPDAGNGILAATGQRIAHNDPTDANLAVTADFQAEWVRHLTNRWGAAAAGGVRYYCMDNEWGLWHETHRDVWPVGATMEQMRDRFCEYAAAVKDVDAGAQVVAPEEWGWTGYLYSGYDAQWGAAHGWGSLPDRAAHGGMDLMPWWLDQVRQRSLLAGRRLLDIFSLHFYPQGGEFSDDVSAAMQLRRNRSTRALWDTNYVDGTWINAAVALVPRMKAWVATGYPGTAVGITEYNWGAEGHMNGATAQADILGILGREGVDLATRWVAPATDTPVGRAIRMFRNYDGLNGTFGETSVRATVPDPDTVSAFAAVRAADRALTVMLVNKQPSADAEVVVIATNFSHVGVARVWQLATNAISRQPDALVATNRVTLTLPAQSVALLVVPAPPRVETLALLPSDECAVTLRGESGQHYALETSGDLVSWQRLQTNALVGNLTVFPVAATNERAFCRGVWVP